MIGCLEFARDHLRLLAGSVAIANVLLSFKWPHARFGQDERLAVRMNDIGDCQPRARECALPFGAKVCQ
jgi:hypothetical protein